MSTKYITPINVDDESLVAEAYTQVLPQLKAIPESEIAYLNVDIPSAVTTVLGSLPEITALREAIAKALPDFDVTRVDKLETYTLALSHTHRLYLASGKATDDLPALNDEGTLMRERLRADANALAVRGLIEASALAECKGQTGYKNMATDLQVLVGVLRGAWPQIEGRCATSAAELDRADKIATCVLRCVGLRAEGLEAVNAAADERARAFTLFVRCYDDVRRAVAYLRWHEGDADEIAPSLYAGRERKAKQDEPEIPATTPDAPVAPPVPIPTPELPGGSPFVQ